MQEMSTVTVKWYAADGYVGKDRPKYAEIEVSDFSCMDANEAEELLDEIMQKTFLQQVNWECADYKTSIAEIMAAASAQHKIEEDELSSDTTDQLA
jgi:hypothetical protein